MLGHYGEWAAYTAMPNGRKVCFALAKPTSSQTNAPGRSRDPAFVFISDRPAEKVKDEVSIIIGYPFKPSTEASVEIGTSNIGFAVIVIKYCGPVGKLVCCAKQAGTTSRSRTGIRSAARP